MDYSSTDDRDQHMKRPNEDSGRASSNLFMHGCFESDGCEDCPSKRAADATILENSRMNSLSKAECLRNNYTKLGYSYINGSDKNYKLAQH